MAYISKLGLLEYLEVFYITFLQWISLFFPISKKILLYYGLEFSFSTSYCHWYIFPNYHHSIFCVLCI